MLKDKSISDFQLQSTVDNDDGEAVLANKSMLAARSPIFRSLLFGNGDSSSNDNANGNGNASSLQVNYSKQVLQAVVEYIYTDDVTVIQKDTTTDSVTCNSDTIVALIDAANHYQLPKLKRKCETYIASLLIANPLLAVPILVSCQQFDVVDVAGGGADDSTPTTKTADSLVVAHDLCHHVIRSSPRLFLQQADRNKSNNHNHGGGGCDLSDLSYTQIQLLLQDDQFG